MGDCYSNNQQVLVFVKIYALNVPQILTLFCFAIYYISVLMVLKPENHIRLTGVATVSAPNQY